MLDLLDDSISEILRRLPVKSLLRFRCVSKRWCALIDNNSFIKQHLNSSMDNTKHKLILKKYLDLYSVGLYSLTDQPLQLVQPINSNAHTYTILGHCNGLLCISFLYGNLVLLWNPATRKHVKLPAINSRYYVSFHYAFDYGFGYDSVSDDYKVVKLCLFFNPEDHSFIPETIIYNMRTNSWRIIEDSPHYIIDDDGPPTLACGALHWIGLKNSDSSSRLAVAFDLATEEFMMITLPYFPCDEIFSMFVSELGGCLSSVWGNYNKGGVDVWVMKDYGVSESWTKLLTLSTLEIVGSIDDVIPLAYSESGDEVLLALNSEKLIWYNLEKRKSKVVDISWTGQCYGLVVCLESLVSLGEKAENDEMKEQKKRAKMRIQDGALESSQVDLEME